MTMKRCSYAFLIPLLACVALSGCHALRPLPSRQLLAAQAANWGSFSCPGLEHIGFAKSTSALALPLHGLVMGQVRLLNRGDEPFGFETTGFRLSGAGEDTVDGELKCPQRQVPAGGVLECGFVAPAVSPLEFSSLTPFFVPQFSNKPCFCRQAYDIDLFGEGFGPHAPLPTHHDAVKGLADAFAQAFGGPAFSQALSRAAQWQGDVLSLANSITNSLFSLSDLSDNGSDDDSDDGLFHNAQIVIRVGPHEDAPSETPAASSGPTSSADPVPAAAPINQTSTTVTGPEATPEVKPDAKPDVKADATPVATPVATPDVKPDMTPVAKPDATLVTAPVVEAPKQAAEPVKQPEQQKPAVAAPVVEAPKKAAEPAKQSNTTTPAAATARPDAASTAPLAVKLG